MQREFCVTRVCRCFVNAGRMLERAGAEVLSGRPQDAYRLPRCGQEGEAILTPLERAVSSRPWVALRQGCDFMNHPKVPQRGDFTRKPSSPSAHLCPLGGQCSTPVSRPSQLARRASEPSRSDMRPSVSLRRPTRDGTGLGSRGGRPERPWPETVNDSGCGDGCGGRERVSLWA